MPEKKTYLLSIRLAKQLNILYNFQLLTNNHHYITYHLLAIQQTHFRPYATNNYSTSSHLVRMCLTNIKPYCANCNYPQKKKTKNCNSLDRGDHKASLIYQHLSGQIGIMQYIDCKPNYTVRKNLSKCRASFRNQP